MSAIAQQYVEIWRANVQDWHPTPSRLETAAYLTTEAAEALDAVLRIEAPNHDRTNGHHLKAGLRREIGQLLDMTLTLANLYGIDAFAELYAWMAEVEQRNPANLEARVVYTPAEVVGVMAPACGSGAFLTNPPYSGDPLGVIPGGD